MIWYAWFFDCLWYNQPSNRPLLLGSYRKWMNFIILYFLWFLANLNMKLEFNKFVVFPYRIAVVLCYIDWNIIFDQIVKLLVVWKNFHNPLYFNQVRSNVCSWNSIYLFDSLKVMLVIALNRIMSKINSLIRRKPVSFIRLIFFKIRLHTYSVLYFKKLKVKYYRKPVGAAFFQLASQSRKFHSTTVD